MASPFSTQVPGGWGHEGIEYSVGISSGSAGIGFGVSDQVYAITHGKKQKTALHLSLTPEDAEKIGQALLYHAAAVRGKQAGEFWARQDAAEGA